MLLNVRILFPWGRVVTAKEYDGCFWGPVMYFLICFLVTDMHSILQNSLNYIYTLILWELSAMYCIV